MSFWLCPRHYPCGLHDCEEVVTNYSNKLVANQESWAKVSQELEDEQIKLAFYDSTVIELLDNVTNKEILDYGCGPGILLTALQKLGANVRGYDISEEFCAQAGQKIGNGNIYYSVADIPQNHFDFAICNLVLCIVDEDEVEAIMRNIGNCLNDTGYAYIGFCNPKLLDVPETNLDLRPKPQCDYCTNHSYMKTKKEGGYQIIENHRPIEWYETLYNKVGLKTRDVIYTPEYELNGQNIQDFIIFKLSK